MSSVASSSLELFHPQIADWFAERFDSPTEIQENAWPRIAAGEHCLITAATGSGKTLAAFLWGINQLASMAWEPGQTRLLYISPLKALNNDIRRNLLTPLAELEQRFAAADQRWPSIRVMTRSGDTEQSERRKMLRKPPEILITTPESLNLLLTSKDGQRSLLGIRSVILDEIHSVVGSKRGVYLATAVERLANLVGEFQRVALSATVRPMETVAAFVGGFLRGQPRPVSLVESNAGKRYQIEVRFPDTSGRDDDPEDDTVWTPIVADLKQLIDANRSTLVFVNSRALCEKLTYLINLEEESPVAYSHHGSLSKEIRKAVEQRLKRGELKAIVATNSLEMGIDIGALDCVVMVQCPNQISSAVQKVGRSGHQVGAVSKAVLVPTHSRDFLESAVLSRAIRERKIEAARPVERPLDVLAQIIVSMLGSESWDLDTLLEVVQRSYSYRNLSREHFDLVINMLAGRYAQSRLRELKPRISVDRAANTARLRKGALMAYYFAGGVIPDRGYFHMRLSGNGARLGELDEEFVWERKIGDVFTLGAQSWKIDRITYNDVFVAPAEATGIAPPFWRAETYNRDFHYSEQIGRFLEWADERVDDKAFVQELRERFSLNEFAATALKEFLLNQKRTTRCSLPHRYHLLAELVDAGPSGAPGQQLILHTQWGGQVNRPFAFALDAAWAETFGHRTEVYVNNDCVVLMMSEDVTVEEVLRLVDSSKVEHRLRQRLEGSGFFGARFREAAGTALLVTRSRFGQRLPLWLSRMRAKKLFESVQRYDDFPLLLEAWRTCLRDEFDMDALKQVLEELEQGEIRVSKTRAATASPFAASLAWRQINDEYMYATDEARASGQSALREDLVRCLAFDESQRPRIPAEVARSFEAKRQRLAPGYGPTDALELKEWLRDRIAVPMGEWERLVGRVGYAFDEPVDTPESIGGEPNERFVCLPEERERLEALLSGDPDLLVEWLSYYGPVPLRRLETWLRVEPADLMAIVDTLVDERRMVMGTLLQEDEEVWVCEAENFEILLRLNRSRNRPVFQALPVSELPLFQARWQGLLTPGEGIEGTQAALDRVLGVVCSIAEWEDAILPARLRDYHPALLDGALSEYGTLWYGAGEGKVGFALEEDLEVLDRLPEERETVDDDTRAPAATVALKALRRSGGRFTFPKLQELTGLPSSELESALWGLAWRGEVSNDSFAAARRGAAARFRLAEAVKPVDRPGRPRRLGRLPKKDRGVNYPGSWLALPWEDGADEDAVDRMEKQKERARVVLDRYGVVFKELLQREQPGFQWRDVFKALRLLELSGEIVGGRFFEGTSGLQFASREGLRALQRVRAGSPGKEIFWVAASDPASLCGVGLEGLEPALPARRAGVRIVYRGAQLVMEIHREGKAVVIHVEPEDEDLSEMLGAYEALFRRSSGSVGQVYLETINDEDARGSAYLPAFDARFRMHVGHKQVVIEGPR